MTAPHHDPDLVDRLCRVQHDAYEAAALANGWETQSRSRVPWDVVPAANKATMAASMQAVLSELDLVTRPSRYAVDPESVGLADILDALNWQDDDQARARILRYINERYPS